MLRVLDFHQNFLAEVGVMEFELYCAEPKEEKRSELELFVKTARQ